MSDQSDTSSFNGDWETVNDSTHELEMEIEKMREENKTMKTKIREKDEEIAEKNIEIEKKDGKVKTLREKEEAKDKENEELRWKIETMEKEMAKLQDGMRTVKREMKQKDEEIAGKNIEISEKSMEIEKKNGEVKSLREKEETKNKDIEEMRSQIEAVDKETEKLRNETKIMKTKLEKKDAEIAGKNITISDKNIEIENKDCEVKTLREKEATKDKDIAEMRSKNETLEKEMSMMREETMILRTEMEKKDEEIAEKNLTIEKMDKEISEKNMENEKKEEEIKTLRENDAAKDQEIEELKSKIEQASTISLEEWMKVQMEKMKFSANNLKEQIMEVSKRLLTRLESSFEPENNLPIESFLGEFTAREKEPMSLLQLGREQLLLRTIVIRKSLLEGYFDVYWKCDNGKEIVSAIWAPDNIEREGSRYRIEKNVLIRVFNQAELRFVLDDNELTFNGSYIYIRNLEEVPSVQEGNSKPTAKNLSIESFLGEFTSDETDSMALMYSGTEQVLLRTIAIRKATTEGHFEVCWKDINGKEVVSVHWIPDKVERNGYCYWIENNVLIRVYQQGFLCYALTEKGLILNGNYAYERV